MWTVKQKVSNKLTEQTHRYRQQNDGYQRQGKGAVGKESQIYDDGRKLDFGGKHAIE